MAQLTLRRPDQLNAMTATMFAELVGAAERIRDRDDVRAVVLTGAGRGFCGGFDLAHAGTFPERSTAQLLALQDLGVRALHAVYSLPQPVVAAVHGPAAGGGFSLALAADIRIAAASARFSAVFVRLGLSGADLGTSWLLPRIVGAGLAAELLYTGRTVGPEEAVRIKLANSMVDDDAALDAALALTDWIARHETSAVRLTKRSLRANTDAPSFLAALELESRSQVLLMREPATTDAVARLRERSGDGDRDGDQQGR